MKPRGKHNPVLLALLLSGAIAILGDGANARIYDYATGRGVSTRNLQRLNYYSQRGQSARDVRRILGSSPNRIGRDVEVYTIRESVDSYQGIPLNAGNQLVVCYDRTGKTSGWYRY